MKYNKYDIVSYVSRKKTIHAKIIDFIESKTFFVLGFELSIPEMYVVKTRKGNVVRKYEDEVELIKDVRLEKLKKICNDN